MAVPKNFTLGADNFTGTAGDDWFSGPVLLDSSNLQWRNTLQSTDTVVGGGGWDTIEATLIGGENIAPTASEVEKLKLKMRDDKGDVNLYLGNMPDLEKIRVENSKGTTHHIYEVGDVEDFVFSKDTGALAIGGSTAQTLDFSFSETGETGQGNEYVLYFENQEATNATVGLNDAFTYLVFTGSSDLTHLSIDAEGNSRFSLNGATDSLEEVMVSGQGNRLNLQLNFQSGLESMNAGGANGFTGDLYFQMYGATKEKSHFQSGIGNDEIKMNEVVSNGTTILSGKGDDKINIEKDVGNDVTIRTGALPGKDRIIIKGEVGEHFNVFTEEGLDRLIIEKNLGRDAYIHMGKGKDDVEIDGTVGDNANIMTGAGNDEVVIKGHLGSNGTIATGTGEDYVEINDALDDQQRIETKDDDDKISIYGDVKGDASIDSGNGDDVVSLRDPHTLSSTYKVKNASIDLGNGDDLIIMKDIGTEQDTVVDGGTGADTIWLDADTVDDYSVGGRSNQKAGMHNFETIVINEMSDNTQNQTYDMHKFNDINDVIFYEGVEGEDNRLIGIESGASLKLYDNKGGGKLKIIMDHAENSDNDILDLEVMSAAYNAFHVGLMGNIETINIASMTAENVYNIDVDLDGTAALDTISVSGYAPLNLTYGSTELEASTFTSTNTGGVTVSLTKPNIGGGSDKHVVTGSGDDVITTTDGRDSISAGDGDNTITSGLGGDTITTGVGNDTIYAGKGHDTIISGEGKDAIYAGVGNDKIYAGKGGDTIEGKVGNDEIHAGLGMDRVSGGEDGDTIYLGDDDKKDTLVYSSLDDSKGSSATTRDTVYDFGSGEDQIDLTGVVGTVTYVGEFTSQAALESAIENGGAGSAGLLIGSSSSVLYMSVDGDGDLSDDMQIELVGVNDMVQGDFV